MILLSWLLLVLLASRPTKGRAVEELANTRCYANAVQQDADDATAAEQEALVAAAEEASITSRQMSCSHMMMTQL